DDLVDSAHFVFGLGRLHEDHVCPGLGIGVGTFQGSVQAKHGASVGAGHNNEVVVLAGVCRAYDAVDHDFGNDHTAAQLVTAALRQILVFQLDGGNAGFFEFSYRAPDTERTAIAGVSVRNERQGGRVRTTANLV